ncbi:MAG TPA: type II toxin-antitoxin system VapC family toxin [Plasticicumulans sp.]|nr:type II toxin-antitoxin system VapC family toxin [Plasticicumulans sp.]HNK31764.1 type II toxin-antitoxin system VapC family toxin [Plasticicumulans sp.]
MIVVDAGALAAVLFLEAGYEPTLARIGEAPLCAPTLLPYELTNIRIVKERRQPSLAAALALQFDAFLRLDIDYVTPFQPEVAALARRYAVTAYDAAYLWLALTRSLPLVTTDSRLHTAWQQATAPHPS